MLRSYVGIATRHGLETLLPEHAEVSRLLQNPSHHSRSEKACYFWAVLPEAAAQEVRQLLAAGDRFGALITLDHCARQLGPLLSPSETPLHEPTGPA